MSELGPISAIGPFRTDGRWPNDHSDDEPLEALSAADGPDGRRLSDVKRRQTPTTSSTSTTASCRREQSERRDDGWPALSPPMTAADSPPAG